MPTITREHWSRWLLSAISVSISIAVGYCEDDAFELDPVLVRANRVDPIGISYRPTSFTRSSLKPTDHDLSSSLRAYPGLSAFRRAQSYAAHPTTQGVRIRNIGATASSRSLVLLDGVPQNDPFGGWIYWHQYSSADLEQVSISPSSGGETWGNLGSGGVVLIASRSPVHNQGLLQTNFGSAGAYSANLAATQVLGDDMFLDIGGRLYDTPGFFTLREDQRGSLDEKSFSTSESFHARLRWNPREEWRLQFSARIFDEERGNGTPLARNDTSAANFALIAQRELIDTHARLSLVAYHQDRDFRNVFTSVDAERASERAALDQYDVPAEAQGLALSYHMDLGESDYYMTGIDIRATEGFVNEQYRNLGNGFTRDRFAGGKQAFFGAYATLAKSVSENDSLTATVRFDRIENDNASRVETDTTSDIVLREDTYPDRSDDELSINLQWRHQFSDQLSSHVAAFSGFRSPTLNELYRPFRVRNDITEANPQLSNEELKGVELALIVEEPKRWRYQISAFHYAIDSMVANALLTTESGFDPRFGFIPNGGSGSQRVNLDESSVSGIEAQATLYLSNSLSAEATVVYASTEVDGDVDLPQFAGKAFPQSSPWKARLGIDWQTTAELQLWAAVDFSDDAFENILNTRVIENATLASIGGRYAIGDNHGISFVVNNLFNETVVSGISNSGLVTIDAPREARIGWDWRF